MVKLALIILALMLAGCALRQSIPEPLQLFGANYIDLQPGWRLRVVTPILRSGGYRVRSAPLSGEGASLTAAVDDDFEGYEVSYYSVGRHGLKFDSAEVTRNGNTIPRPRPIIRLFSFPGGIRHVRLIYLTRQSQADHDMAAVGARDIEALEAMTRRVEANPAAGCHEAQDASCTWIPAGIAVVPELRRKVNGATEWSPAR